MKVLALIAAICLGIALAACGDDGSTAATTQEPTREKVPGSTAVESTPSPIAGVSRPPKVHVPSGPPPTGLVVREIKKGSGAPLVPNAKLAFRYVGVEYESGKTFETRWGQPFKIQAFGNGELLVGQERGMRGMRVGGRRELIIPERLAYENGVGPLIYVIELVSVEKK